MPTHQCLLAQLPESTSQPCSQIGTLLNLLKTSIRLGVTLQLKRPSGKSHALKQSPFRSFVNILILRLPRSCNESAQISSSESIMPAHRPVRIFTSFFEKHNISKVSCHTTERNGDAAKLGSSLTNSKNSPVQAKRSIRNHFQGKNENLAEISSKT